MKITELRALLAAAEPEKINKAFGECYKKLTKSKKEEIDPLITDILKGIEPEKAAKKSPKDMDFGELKAEIDEFLLNAYADNYFAPNRIIPKARRSKWRFEAKGFLKALTAINEANESFDESVVYLTKLFDVLSYGCIYHIFTGYDTFRSVGMEQEELFGIVVSRRLSSIGYTKENMKTMLWMAAHNGTSVDSGHELLMKALIINLKTTDSKYLAIETANELIDEKKKTLSGRGKYSTDRYFTEDSIQQLAKGIMCLAAALGEVENHISGYFINFQKYQLNTALHFLLKSISDYGTEKDWLWAYDYSVKKLKITPPPYLIKEHNEHTKK